MQAVNPKTGEVFELRGGQWVPVGEGRQPELATEAPKPERLSTGAVNAALVSAGDELTTWGRNARDLWAGLRGDTATQADIAFERAEADDIRRRLHDEAPIAAGVGSALPYLATMGLGAGVGVGRAGVLGADMLAGTAGRYGTNVALGALQGAAGSQSGDMSGDALTGGIWSAGAPLASNMVSRVWKGRAAMREAREAYQAEKAIAGGLDEGEQAVIDGARRAGMRVTPGQALGDPTMRRIEASAGSQPMLSAYWDELKGHNYGMLNKLAAKAMGVEADNVGARVRAQAEHMLENDFEQVGKGLGAVPSTKLHAELQQLAAEEATAAFPTRDAWNALKRFERGIEGRAGAAAGEVADTIHGPDLLKMRSQVSREMRDAFAANDANRGQMLAEVLDRVDKTIGDAALAAGKPHLVDVYDKARERWNVLRALDHGGATTDGQVSVGALARNIAAGDKTGYWGRAGEAGEVLQRQGTGTLGQNATGDLYDALRFANSRIGKDIVGDSGTATRLALADIFKGEGGTLAVGGRALKYAYRKALAGPLANYYMTRGPEAIAAWQAAANQSALAGWAAGRRAGEAASRVGQALMGGM